MFFSSYFNKGEKEGENELTEEAVIVLLVILFSAILCDAAAIATNVSKRLYRLGLK